MSPKIAVVMPGDGTVSVVDAVILAEKKDAVAGKVVRNNAQRLVVKWPLENIKAGNGRSFANFDYRLSIAKKSGHAELTAVPRAFAKGLRSAGTCKTRRK